uniref:ULP_PROTEASE domain-containing protein n=1 Tax=Ascaris lumbricoides TaxID=6252 RepID=A0A0M3ILV3_ASCLU
MRQVTIGATLISDASFVVSNDMIRSVEKRAALDFDTMPQYLDADVPMARRRDCKDTKIYRKCFGHFGPNIISKYICAASQQSSVNSLPAEERENKQKLSARLMHQTDPFGIEDFDVPYSANKKQRWNFMNCAEKRASTLQDQEYRVRVSLIRSKIMRADKENDAMAETPGNHILTTYYTFDGDNAIEKRGKRMTFASVSRKPNPPRHRRGRLIRNAASSSSEQKAEDKQDISEDETMHIFYKEQCFDMTKREINMNKKMKPNPPRHRRGRLIRNAASSSSEPKAEDKQDISEDETIHIFYKEQCFDMTKREINMNKKMKPNPPRHRRGRLIRNAASSSSEQKAEDKQDISEDETMHIFYKEQCFDMTKREINMNKKMKREKNARVSQHRHSKRFPSDETEDAYGAVCDQFIHDDSFSAQEEDWRCYADVNSPLLEPLQDFIVTTKKIYKGKRKRRRSEADDSGINEHRVIVIEHDKFSQSSSDPTILLPTITLSSVLNGSFCSVVESKFPNARKVDRFQPSTYAVRIGGESYEMLESVLPKGFVGTVFVQDAGPSQDSYLLRCILNESELSRSLTERRLGNELNKNLNSESQSTALTPIGHLPKSAFVDREVYTQMTAAFQALSDLSSKAVRIMNQCDAVVPSSTDILVCGACYVEDEP